MGDSVFQKGHLIVADEFTAATAVTSRATLLASTNLGACPDHPVGLILDGRDNTYFQTSWAVPANGWVMVDLGATRSITKVEIRLVYYFNEGVVEASQDGLTSWVRMGDLFDKQEFIYTAPAGTEFRYIRLRNAGGQGPILHIRRINVTLGT
ncbi:discoidin domain-containing protein [Streptomyces sp. NPDC029216]|uniref:discoidin domain-containing protein n=1 Tax=Streptomyces sp. NPDC029216 TaxID=3154701 RepID=UPI0033FA2BF1